MDRGFSLSFCVILILCHLFLILSLSHKQPPLWGGWSHSWLHPPTQHWNASTTDPPLKKKSLSPSPSLSVMSHFPSMRVCLSLYACLPVISFESVICACTFCVRAGLWWRSTQYSLQEEVYLYLSLSVFVDVINTSSSSSSSSSWVCNGMWPKFKWSRRKWAYDHAAWTKPLQEQDDGLPIVLGGHGLV